MYYLGVDLGTTAVKMLIMNEQGKVERIVSRDYPLYLGDNGHSEQDPKDWWEAVKDGVKALVSGFAPDQIRAVSFSGQMHGLVMLDEKDEPIRRAILWNDQRTQAQCDELHKTPGRDALIGYTANVALTGFTAPKLLWVKENEPELFAKITKVMLPKDYISYCLSGVFATDYSDASGTLLLDVQNKRWSAPMLEIVGLTENQLPKLYASYEAVGTVRPAIAKELGLSSETKVVIGGGDQAVGAVGTGTVSRNACSISLGTSGVVFVASDKFKVDRGASALHSFCHATGGYHMMGVTLAAAASNKWWVEQVLQTEDYPKEQAPIHELGKNKVYFLPYLSGERTPHNDPYARGAFVGMTMQTARAEMTQAVMEGVLFSLRDTLTVVQKLGIDVQSTRITGGGSQSPLWCQMAADIFNARVEKINSPEGPAFGAAILAAVGDGRYENVETACGALIAVTESFAPSPEAAVRYNRHYEIYKKLYLDLKDTFKDISAE